MQPSTAEHVRFYNGARRSYSKALRRPSSATSTTPFTGHADASTPVGNLLPEPASPSSREPPSHPPSLEIASPNHANDPEDSEGSRTTASSPNSPNQLAYLAAVAYGGICVEDQDEDVDKDKERASGPLRRGSTNVQHPGGPAASTSHCTLDAPPSTTETNASSEITVPDDSIIALLSSHRHLVGAIKAHTETQRPAGTSPSSAPRGTRSMPYRSAPGDPRSHHNAGTTSAVSPVVSSAPSGPVEGYITRRRPIQHSPLSGPPSAPQSIASLDRVAHESRRDLPSRTPTTPSNNTSPPVVQQEHRDPLIHPSTAPSAPPATGPLVSPTDGDPSTSPADQGPSTSRRALSGSAFLPVTMQVVAAAKFLLFDPSHCDVGFRAESSDSQGDGMILSSFESTVVWGCHTTAHQPPGDRPGEGTICGYPTIAFTQGSRAEVRSMGRRNLPLDAMLRHATTTERIILQEQAAGTIPVPGRNARGAPERRSDVDGQSNFDQGAAREGQ